MTCDQHGTKRWTEPSHPPNYAYLNRHPMCGFPAVQDGGGLPIAAAAVGGAGHMPGGQSPRLAAKAAGLLFTAHASLRMVSQYMAHLFIDWCRSSDDG